jgi:hypothetical protein
MLRICRYDFYLNFSHHILWQWVQKIVLNVILLNLEFGFVLDGELYG